MRMITKKNNLYNITTWKLNSGLKVNYKNNQENSKILILANIACWILSIISIICIIFSFIPILSILNDMSNSNINSLIKNYKINANSLVIGARQLSANKNFVRNLLLNLSSRFSDINRDSFIKTFGGDFLVCCADSYGEFYRTYMYCYFYLIQTINSHKDSGFVDSKDKLSNTFVEHANAFLIDLGAKYMNINNRCLDLILSLGEKCFDIDYLIDQILELIFMLSSNLSRYQASIWKSELFTSKRDFKYYELRDVILLFSDLFIPDNKVNIANKFDELQSLGCQLSRDTVFKILNTVLYDYDESNLFLKLINIKYHDIVLNMLLHLVKLLINHRSNISIYKSELRSMDFRHAMKIAITDLNILQNIDSEMSLTIDNIQNRMYMYSDVADTLQFPYIIKKEDYGNIISNWFGFDKIAYVSQHKEYILNKILKRANDKTLHGFMCKSGLEAYLRNHYRIEFESFEKDVGNFCKYSTWDKNYNNTKIIRYMKLGIDKEFSYNEEEIQKAIYKHLSEINNNKSTSTTNRDSYSYGDIINLLFVLT